MYLNDWKDTGFIGLVSDFSGICMRNKEQMNGELKKEQWAGIDVLLASYGYGGYSGTAFVLFKKNGKLYEVNASHAFSDGLEGLWFPDETNVESLMHRVDSGGFGDQPENKFATELRKVLSEIQY